MENVNAAEEPTAHLEWRPDGDSFNQRSGETAARCVDRKIEQTWQTRLKEPVFYTVGCVSLL